MKKVAVMMSTYNGEDYVLEQINSILNQNNVEVTLFIRDDGSSDRTIEIIKNIKNNKIKMVSGKNIGPCKSFLELLSQVNLDYDYYAFSDQDDYWYNQKLNSAIEKIENFDSIPSLYYSALNYCDEKLNITHKHTNSITPDFGFSLIRSIFPGCTMVFNNQVLKLFKNKKFYNQIMHDQLIYQVVSGVGGFIYYDQNSHINYRIHSQNVSNYKSIIKKSKKLFKEFFYKPNERLKALKELQNNFRKELLNENYKVLNNIVKYQEYSLKRKLKLIKLNNDTKKNSLIFLTSLLFNKF